MRVSAQPAWSLQRLGVDLDCFSSFHVTGYEGKGSVCALIVAGIGHENRGVFASPHVERVNERVRICGQPNGDDQLAVVKTINYTYLVSSWRGGIFFQFGRNIEGFHMSICRGACGYITTIYIEVSQLAVLRHSSPSSFYGNRHYSGA